MEHNLELVNAVASQVQAALNEAAGIGIKPISATLDDDRIHRIVSSAADTPTITAMHGWLGEAVINTTQSFADEFIRANAEFHYQSGLSPKIVRTSTGKCCDWCNNLAGTYDYEDARENGVFRRHDYCRCVVDFYSKKGERETVHTGTEGKRKYVRSEVSGKYYLTDEADQARKIAHRKEMEATAKERKKAAREKRIATWARKKETASTRAMSNGPRRGAFTRVTEAEQHLILQEADALAIPRDVLSFNTGPLTSFDDATGLIHIRGDIFPSTFAENPESILNARCALAHEYYGHLLSHPSRFNIGDWRDEFHASYRAALDTPGLTDEERAMLMLDAFERATAANIPVRLSKIARSVIYGTE